MSMVKAIDGTVVMSADLETAYRSIAVNQVYAFALFDFELAGGCDVSCFSLGCHSLHVHMVISDD